MPTSVAHMIGGYAALEAGAAPCRRGGIFFLFLVIVAANLPDLDFLPGMLVGDVGLFHRGPSHSLAAAILAAGALGWILGSRLGGFRRVAGWTFVAYASHLVLDMVVPDPTGVAKGVPLLWPLIPDAIGAPLPGLAIVDPLRVLSSVEMQSGFFRALFSWSGVRIFLVDAALVTPLVPLAWGLRRLRRRREGARSAVPLRPDGAAADGGPGGGRCESVRVRRGRVLVGSEARQRER